MTAIVIAIHPQWVRLILSGIKRVEIRKSSPRRPVDRMLIYDTGMHRIVGEARIIGVDTAHPADIWHRYGRLSCIRREDYDQYARGRKLLTAIRLDDSRRYDKPKTLEEIGLNHAPQNWLYLEDKETN